MTSLDNRIPPPLVMLVAGALAWGLARLTPALTVSFDGQIAAGSVTAALGVIISLAGIVSFSRARTTVSPVNPGAATALVQSGIYRWTRNPMYLGMALLLLAWTLKLGHPGGLVAIVLFAAYIEAFQIRPEERALSELFGDAYVDYCKHVRRWL